MDVGSRARAASEKPKGFGDLWCLLPNGRQRAWAAHAPQGAFGTLTSGPAERHRAGNEGDASEAPLLVLVSTCRSDDRRTPMAPLPPLPLLWAKRLAPLLPPGPNPPLRFAEECGRRTKPLGLAAAASLPA